LIISFYGRFKKDVLNHRFWSEICETMVIFLRYKSSFYSIGFRVNSWLGLVDLG
jgi:hypothetical protein